VPISATGVRYVLARHDLETATQRLLALEAVLARGTVALSPSQRAALARAAAEREARGDFDSDAPGACATQDTLALGTLPSGRRLFQQTFVDTYSRLVVAKLYERKAPDTAVDLLRERVAPLFARHGIGLVRVLTDRGAEYCGPPGHPYEQWLRAAGVVHARVQTPSAQTNGLCERLHRTLLAEVYGPAFRQHRHLTRLTLQRVLEGWLRVYNEQRANHEGACRGRTPLETFADVRRGERQRHR
jgi:transposase InsO family protein